MPQLSSALMKHALGVVDQSRSMGSLLLAKCFNKKSNNNVFLLSYWHTTPIAMPGLLLPIATHHWYDGYPHTFKGTTYRKAICTHCFGPYPLLITHQYGETPQIYVNATYLPT